MKEKNGMTCRGILFSVYSIQSVSNFILKLEYSSIKFIESFLLSFRRITASQLIVT